MILWRSGNQQWMYGVFYACYLMPKWLERIVHQLLFLEMHHDWSVCGQRIGCPRPRTSKPTRRHAWGSGRLVHSRKHLETRKAPVSNNIDWRELACDTGLITISHWCTTSLRATHHVVVVWYHGEMKMHSQLSGDVWATTMCSWRASRTWLCPDEIYQYYHFLCTDSPRYLKDLFAEWS